jgi:hypothetical protein
MRRVFYACLVFFIIVIGFKSLISQERRSAGASINAMGEYVSGTIEVPAGFQAQNVECRFNSTFQNLRGNPMVAGEMISYYVGSYRVDVLAGRVWQDTGTSTRGFVSSTLDPGNYPVRLSNAGINTSIRVGCCRRHFPPGTC